MGTAVKGVVAGEERPADVGSPGLHGLGVSARGVVGRLDDFAGPSRASSARKDARSTVSRNVIAASRFVRQYAASPLILLADLNLWM